MKHKVKIKKIIANTFFILLIIVGILVAISLLPIKNNYRLMAVTSGSMEPTIPTGALIIVKPTNSYKEGDVISFRPLDAKSNKDIITHRIKSIEEKDGVKYITTKGDANDGADSGKITTSRIIGKEILAVALIGYFIGFLKTLPGLVLLIIIPATIIIYEEFNKIKTEAREIAKRKRERKEALNAKPKLEKVQKKGRK